MTGRQVQDGRVQDENAAGKRRRKAEPIGALAGRVLEPALAQRAGMNWQLLAAWDAIAGLPHAAWTRPERIRWQRRVSETDAVEPGVLVLACEGSRALEVQHDAAALISRVNAFFGFEAVNKLRIVQKPVAPTPASRPPAPTEADRQAANRLVAAVSDPQLKERLARLGAGVLARNRLRGTAGRK
jgi:hypothetical protein